MADRERRTGRDLAADVACVVLSAVGGLLLLIIKPRVGGTGMLPGPHEVAFALDAGIGAASSAALGFRRRWPAGVAIALLVPFVVSLSAGAAGLFALLNVSIRRRTPVALAVAGLYLLAFVGYYLLWYRQYPFWAAWLWALTEFAAVVAWGMYIRARRQLIASLRERAEVTRDYGTFTNVILFAIVFCETGLVVTPFLPGDSLLFTAGALAALGSLD